MEASVEQVDRIDLPLLRKAVEFIESEPEQFTMGNWWLHSNDGLAHKWQTLYGRTITSCGTVGCIAGWVCHFAGVELINDDSSAFPAAMTALGLTDSTQDRALARELFFPSDDVINQLDQQPSMVRSHVEGVLGITL